MVSSCLLLPTLGAPWGISQPDPLAVYLILDTFIASLLWPTPIEKERERQRDGRRLGELLQYNWPSNALTRRYGFNLARGGGGFGTTHRLAGLGALCGWRWRWRVEMACHFITIVILE